MNHLPYNYFETHDFHTLIQKKQAQNRFSILHTNICFLYANSEDLEILITNLEHNFSVIALSQTWTSKQVTNKQLPERRNYQPFYATQGTTTESGYVKKGLKFKSRRDLDLAYHDNKFQSCWIEILNKKGPSTIIGVCYRHPRKNSNDIFNIKLDGAIIKKMGFSKTSNLNEMCNRFHQKLLNTINKNAPPKKLSNKEMKLQTKLWIDKNILHKINEENKLYKMFMKTQDTFWHTRYKSLRDDLNSNIDRNKKSYLREYFPKHAKNSKETWNKIKQILDDKKSGSDNIYLSESGIIITDPKQVANQINNWFVTVAE